MSTSGPVKRPGARWVAASDSAAPSSSPGPEVRVKKKAARVNHRVLSPDDSDPSAASTLSSSSSLPSSSPQSTLASSPTTSRSASHTSSSSSSSTPAQAEPLNKGKGKERRKATPPPPAKASSSTGGSRAKGPQQQLPAAKPLSNEQRVDAEVEKHYGGHLRWGLLGIPDMQQALKRVNGAVEELRDSVAYMELWYQKMSEAAAKLKADDMTRLELTEKTAALVEEEERLRERLAVLTEAVAVLERERDERAGNSAKAGGKKRKSNEGHESRSRTPGGGMQLDDPVDLSRAEDF